MIGVIFPGEEATVKELEQLGRGAQNHKHNHQFTSPHVSTDGDREFHDGREICKCTSGVKYLSLLILYYIYVYIEIIFKSYLLSLLSVNVVLRIIKVCSYCELSGA
jgi:hypothetical protein